MAKTKEEATDLIAAAMADATVKSGAHQLPPSGEVPLALTGGVPAISQILMPNEALIKSGQDAALADNPFCPANVKMQAEQISRSLALEAPPPPPVQVGVGSTQRMVPASVRTSPSRLHQVNNVKAKALWTAFTGAHKPTLARLAAQKGFVQVPFVWLAQALWALIDIEGWYPTKREGDPDFTLEDKDPSGPIHAGLSEWAGIDLTRQIMLTCERLNIGVLAALAQMFEQLDKKQRDELGKTQITQTVDEWAQ